MNNGSNENVLRQTYTLSKLRQLIDLNGDTTNFDVSFKVVSKNGEPFDIVVVDQTTLDNNPELSYRPASNGQMSGNIIQDKNIYQNYFLVLKAEQPCECDVEIVKKELPKAPVATAERNLTPPPPTAKTTSKPSSEEGGNWKFWLIVGVIAVGAVVLYFIYRHDKKKAKETDNGGGGGDDDDDGDAGPAQSPVRSIVSSHHGTPERSSPETGGGNDLLQRLKRLHMD